MLTTHSRSRLMPVCNGHASPPATHLTDPYTHESPALMPPIPQEYALDAAPAPTPANAYTPLVFWCNSQHTLLSPDRCSCSLLQLGFFRHRRSINDGGSFVTTGAFPLTGKMGMRPCKEEQDTILKETEV